MPDHLHLLVSPRELDIIRFTNVWKSWTTTLAHRHGRMGAIWQPGMWDRSIRNDDDLGRTTLYIVQNPVAAGLVDVSEDWPWVWDSHTARDA